MKMKKLLKSTTALTLAAALALPVPYSVMAKAPDFSMTTVAKGGQDHDNDDDDYNDDDDSDDNKRKHHGKHFDKNVLKDLQPTFWAKTNIEFMYTLGLISGYPDGSFQPNKPVTNAEAVVMTINMLGLQEEAAELEDEKLPFNDANAIPQYARGSVALALEMGMIAESNVFQPNKGATRMDIVSMIILGLGDKAGLESLTDAKLQFSDIAELTDEQRAMLSFAVLSQLVAGYDDKTFKPNKAVTRAELATIIVQAIQKFLDIDDDSHYEHKISGKVIAINTVNKTVTVSHKQYDNVTKKKVSVENTFTVSADAKIYRDEKAVTLADIKPTDAITLVIDQDSKVTFIDAESAEEEEAHNYLVGKVTSLNFTDRTLGIKIANMLDVSLKVATDATIKLNGTTSDFSKLSVNDQIKFRVNQQGEVSELLATSTNVITPTLPVELKGVQLLSLNVESDNKEVNVLFKAERNATSISVILENDGVSTTLTGSDAENYVKLWAKVLNDATLNVKELNQWMITNLGLANEEDVSLEVKFESDNRDLEWKYEDEDEEEEGKIEVELKNDSAAITALHETDGNDETTKYTLTAANLHIEAAKSIVDGTVRTESKVKVGANTNTYVGTEFNAEVTTYFKKYGLELN